MVSFLTLGWTYWPLFLSSLVIIPYYLLFFLYPSTIEIILCLCLSLFLISLNKINPQINEIEFWDWPQVYNPLIFDKGSTNNRDDTWVAKVTIVHLHNRILFCHCKNWSHEICLNMNEHGDYLPFYFLKQCLLIMQEKYTKAIHIGKEEVVVVCRWHDAVWKF